MNNYLSQEEIDKVVRPPSREQTRDHISNYIKDAISGLRAWNTSSIFVRKDLYLLHTVSGYINEAIRLSEGLEGDKDE